MMMATRTRRVEATENASGRTGTGEDATGASGIGIANGGAAAGTPGETTTTGPRGETETSTTTDVALATGTMHSSDATGGGALLRPRKSGSRRPI